MVTGNLPFMDKSEKLTIKRILEMEPEFPKNLKLTPELVDLIK